MQEVIPSMSLYGYADDHSVVDHFNANDRAAELECINNIENCMIDIKR